jgi:L-threonylcarbamoyladenylate synthase
VRPRASFTRVTTRLRPSQIDAAARLLAQGELVAFPTETVYGLGGDALNDRAVAAIFAVKDRPRINPLIVHVTDLAAAESLAIFDDRARELAARFWPGPLSLVLKRRAGCRVSLLASAGLETLALRVPAHELALRLIGAAGTPLAAPSANRSGRVSPTAADHVAAELGGRIAAILDGGSCQVGVESTVVDLSGDKPTLLRPGGLALEAIEEVAGPVARMAGPSGAPRSPGMLASHYAPALPLRLDARSVASDEALLAFGRDVPAGAARVLSLSETGDLVEAAANLFAALRTLERGDHRAIAVMPIPEAGLGLAINDRLRRAAAPRQALAAGHGAG